MSAHPHDTDAWASRMTRNTLGLAAWTAAWVASVALAALGPEILWNNQPAPTLAAIAFSVLVGIGMLFANKRNLQALDELQRTIQLQAMAWSLGAGLVGGVAWSLFARYDLVGFEAEIGHLIAFMALVYLAGCVAGLLRYR
jgi:Na+/H+-dicarboxylate symporter